MSDRDRDDLAALIDQYTPAFDNTHADSVACADAILAAGWRPTASLPERVSEGRLRTCPAHPGHAPFLAVHACPWCTITKLQAARSTVTPEQVEAAAQRMYASFHEQAAESGEQPTPYDFMPWGVNSTVTKFWLEIAQAGLSVGEDGAS